jgi:hypothetical protein
LFLFDLAQLYSSDVQPAIGKFSGWVNDNASESMIAIDCDALRSQRRAPPTAKPKPKIIM